MAVNGNPWALGSDTHNARVLRNLPAAVFGLPLAAHANSVSATTRGGGYGVVGSGDFLVTSTGGLGYSVAAGRCVLPGTTATAQGAYTGYNDAAITGSVGARHATLTRVDLICYRVRDTDEDATTFEDDDVVVVAGTAGSGVPAIPSTLGSLLVLAEVSVPGTSPGTALTFTDRRTFASALGGIQRVTSSTNPTGAAAYESKTIYESDTDRLYVHNGTSFIPFGEIGAWRTSASLTAITQGVAVSATSWTLRYTQIGKTVMGHLYVVISTAGTGGSALTFTTSGLPAIATTTPNVGTAYYIDSGALLYTGNAELNTSGVFQIIVSGSTSAFGASPSVAAANTDQAHIHFMYEAA